VCVRQRGAAQRQCCGGTPEACLRFVLERASSAGLTCAHVPQHTFSLHPAALLCNRRGSRPGVLSHRALEHQGNFDMLRSLTCHLQARLTPTALHSLACSLHGARSLGSASGLGRLQSLRLEMRGLRRCAQAHQGGMGMVGVSPRYAQRAAHKFSQFWWLPHRERVVKVGSSPEGPCCEGGLGWLTLASQSGL